MCSDNSEFIIKLQDLISMPYEELDEDDQIFVNANLHYWELFGKEESELHQKHFRNKIVRELKPKY